MNNHISSKVLALAAATLFLVPASFASTNSCANTVAPIGGFVSFTCDLYYNSPNTNPIDLSPFMTQGGSSLLSNDITPNYTVVINGNPGTLADDSTGLFNESLWQAVLFFPGSLSDGNSDTLDVFWPGGFPSASTVQSFNQASFGPGTDADFFVQATGSLTIIGAAPAPDIQFDVFTPPSAPVPVTPEPASFTLMATGILGFALLATMKRQGKLAAQTSIDS